MSTPYEALFDYPDILDSSVDPGTGTVVYQTGNVDGSPGNSDGTELYGPPNYYARPAQATATDAPQGVAIRRGDHDVVLGVRDVRGAANALATPLGYGETQLVAPGPGNSGSCNILLNNDGQGNLKITLTVGSNSIEITTDQTGSINVVANHVNLGQASDFAALASKVDANFSALATTLGSGSNSGGPVVFSKPFSPTSTAAQNVKIS